MKKRNSSIELLKIIAMILITINHSMPVYGNQNLISYIPLGNTTNNFGIMILTLLKCSGQIGNIIFICCSAYYLLDKEKTKKEKIIIMLIDMITISIIWLVIILLIGIPINKIDLIKQFFPMTFENNWFVSCYILLYMIHPYLNKIINSININEYFRINLILFILYCCIQFILNNKYYFTKLVGFIIIYLFVGFNKKYCKKLNKNISLNIKLLIISIVLNIGLIYFTNILGSKISLLSDKLLYWNYCISNPLYIIIGISLLNIFKNFEFSNKVIDYISSLSLIYYLIHENMLFSNYLRPIFYQRMFVYGNIGLWITIEFLILLFIGLLLSCIYKQTIKIILKKYSLALYKFIKEKYLKIENLIVKKIL